MKTIIALAVAGIFTWSFATAQIPSHYTKTEAGTVNPEKAPPLETMYELIPANENNNAWFPDYKKYVHDNLRYPVSASELGIEGVVYAEALVTVEGKLTDIQIVKGLSYSCNQEVLRLLSEMPAWKPARRNGKPYEQKVYVRVRFKLKSV